MHNFCLSDAIIERFHDVESELGNSEHITSLDCAILDTWEFRERESFELGSINDLAQSIQIGGQCHPIIVVKASEEFKPKNNILAQYVIISGYRRWMACKKLNVKVQAIVRHLNIEQAISILIFDNEKEHVSDYSKGMFYHNVLTRDKISVEQLSQKLNMKPSVLNSYLAFAQVPSELWIAVRDLTKVSAKTAAAIRDIASKGTKYYKALLQIADKIAQGYGEKRIEHAVEKIMNKNKKITIKETSKDHKITFDGKIISNFHDGRIKLDSSLTHHGNYEELIAKLEKEIINFATAYLKK